MATEILTAQRLRELFHYDPDTGIFTRIAPIRNGTNLIGTVGCINTIGYHTIGIDRGRYLSHRLAWLYVYGEWPHEVDHINGNRADNRISNLRDVTRTQNAQNQRKPRQTNVSGYIGITPVGVKWRSRIKTAKKITHLGMFDTPEAAHNAYVTAKRIQHPGGTI